MHMHMLGRAQASGSAAVGKKHANAGARSQVRAMLAVPYFEKALYELPEDQVGGASGRLPRHWLQ